ncbi:MAG TPA: hypothetical protein VFW62_05165 [bacterium]|nr:hypothetical protein [bacterium]
MSWLFSVWMAIFLALLYGIVAFLTFRYPAFKNTFKLMTVAYLFIVPIMIGAITVFFGEWSRRRNWWYRIFMPWATVAVLACITLLLAWEGAICVVMILPSFLIMASLGGVLYGLVRDMRGNRLGGFAFAALLALPFLVAPLESRFSQETEYRKVHTAIDIAAPGAAVWPEIIEVRKFKPEEHRFSWVHAIGFPRPVEATLDRPGIGGIRQASFEGNVLFIETIDHWEEGRSLSFNIAADPDSIPQRTLDEHVTVGGPYFDVLQGRYEIEPLDSGRVRLHLTSFYRLTTPFNFYSSLWTDFVMRDIQKYILVVLKERSEG